MYKKYIRNPQRHTARRTGSRSHSFTNQPDSLPFPGTTSFIRGNLISPLPTPERFPKIHPSRVLDTSRLHRGGVQQPGDTFPRGVRGWGKKEVEWTGGSSRIYVSGGPVRGARGAARRPLDPKAAREREKTWIESPARSWSQRYIYVRWQGGGWLWRSRSASLMPVQTGSAVFLFLFLMRNLLFRGLMWAVLRKVD